MNKDIEIMIELQGYWNKILNSRNEIEKSNNKIKNIEEEIALKLKNMENLKMAIKTLKNTIKEKEVDLAELDEKLKKLNERINLLKSEREIEAQNTEIEKIKESISEKEESLIVLMDDLDDKENEFKKSEAGLASLKNEGDSTVEEMKNKIGNCEDIIAVNRKKFDERIESLSPSYKPKFLKLLNTKSGRAIGEIHNNICSSCNFQIPAFLAQESLKDENVVTCTNCGRFLYSN